MKGDFFSNYEEFIILPADEQKANQEFNAGEYASHFILTLSLYDSLIVSWSEAGKFEIEIEMSLQKVLEDFNRKQGDCYHVQLLELDREKSYFVMALSCKNKVENEEAEDRISYVLEILLSNHFYVGQSWYRLIGDKGRIKRKLFTYSYKEYLALESVESR
jgi:hypothetical protein